MRKMLTGMRTRNSRVRSGRGIVSVLLKSLAGILAAAGLVLAAGVGAEAAPAVMADGQIFDAEYYAKANPDVAAQFGTDEDILYEHYKNFGSQEGRLPYDPSLTQEELLQQTEDEMLRRVIKIRQKNAPKDYDAATALAAITGLPADSDQVKDVIRNVNTLSPAAPLCFITYEFGNATYTVGPELAMTLMKTNDDGSFILQNNAYVPDETKVRNLVALLQQFFGTKSTKGRFTATDGRVVNLNDGSRFGGKFENNVQLDADAETKFLMSAITQNKTQTRVPMFKPDKDYVEVDIRNQKAYYYKGGKQVLATNIVTGNSSNGHNTPTGVYSIRAKGRNTYLVGENYKSFVQYWMPIIGNSIGLHDASWRSSFGGNIYTYNGSHGCINMPTSAAKKLFESAPVGTTVLVIN